MSSPIEWATKITRPAPVVRRGPQRPQPRHKGRVQVLNGLRYPEAEVVADGHDIGVQDGVRGRPVVQDDPG